MACCRREATSIGFGVRIRSVGGAVNKLARPKDVQGVASTFKRAPPGPGDGRRDRLDENEQHVAGDQTREAHARAPQQVGSLK